MKLKTYRSPDIRAKGWLLALILTSFCILTPATNWMLLAVPKIFKQKWVYGYNTKNKWIVKI